MDTITLTYPGYSQAYTVLGVRGFKRFDEVEPFPQTQQDLPDGSIRQSFSGARRIITIFFGVISVKADRTFFVNWIMSNAMQVTYNGYTVDVVLEDWQRFGTERKMGIILSKSLTLRLREKYVNTVAPTIFSIP